MPLSSTIGFVNEDNYFGTSDQESVSNVVEVASDVEPDTTLATILFSLASIFVAVGFIAAIVLVIKKSRSPASLASNGRIAGTHV